MLLTKPIVCNLLLPTCRECFLGSFPLINTNLLYQLAITECLYLSVLSLRLTLRIQMSSRPVMHDRSQLMTTAPLPFNPYSTSNAQSSRRSQHIPLSRAKYKRNMRPCGRCSALQKKVCIYLTSLAMSHP